MTASTRVGEISSTGLTQIWTPGCHVEEAIVDGTTELSMRTEPSSGASGPIARRPIVSFLVLAFAFSWSLWTTTALVGGAVGEATFLIGSFGPFAAAAIVVAASGRSVGRWFRGLFRWRVHPKWWGFALGVPIALVVLVTAEFAAFGRELDWSILGERIAIYIPLLLVTAVAGGGNEEPGWRGYALPRLLERMTPVRATLLLGSLWAVWHVPLLWASEDAAHGLDAGGVAVIAVITLTGIVGYAFFYTYLLARTGSVLLCIVLHAGFNTALSFGGLRLEDDLQRWDYVLVLALTTATTWLAVAILLALTGGRLGVRAERARHRREERPMRPGTVVAQ